MLTEIVRRKTSVQLVLENDLQPEQKGFLEKTLTSAQSLLRLLTDTLDLSKMVDGTISFESEEGEGSCFFFTIPFEVPQAE